MVSINTNLSSLIAQKSLTSCNKQLEQAIVSMTTGYKINSAKDNAANYSISTNMLTHIGAYNIAEENTAMGLDLVSVASDTISILQDKLSRLRALSVQVNNGTYGAKSKNAIQEEANLLIEEMSRIYKTAEYNGISLFNNTVLNQTEKDYGNFTKNPFTYDNAYVETLTAVSSVQGEFTKDKYKIKTLADLLKLAELIEDGKDTTGITFILAADIDIGAHCAGSTEGWLPIGISSSKAFKGTFDGNGHVIKNIKINRNSNYQGLFGCISSTGTVKNLGLESGSVKGKSYVGSIVGYINGTMENVYSTTTVIGSGTYSGGLIGQAYNSSKIINCHADGNVDGATGVGGLAGGVTGNIYSCYSTGSVKGSGSYIGGLIGAISSPIGINIISDSASYSLVTGGNSESTGSLIGAAIIVNNDGTSATIDLTNVNVLSQSLDPIGGAFKSNLTKVTGFDLSDLLKNISMVSSIPSQQPEKQSQLKKKDFILQVGIWDNSASTIRFDINFDIDFLNLKTNFGNEKTLKAIDDFTNLLNEKTTQLGSIQSRLDSTLKSIDINRNNLISSLSTTRDADIAELSSKYLQQQILQQASSTLLSTANQTPSIVLQLI